MKTIRFVFYAALFTLAFSLTMAKSTRSTLRVTSSPRVVTSSTPPNTSPPKRMRCPYECECDPSKMEVNCSNQKLTYFPTDIPRSTRRLILAGNQITRLPNRHMWALSSLEVLDLSRNSLTSISNRLLRRQRKLKHLNLSSNKLQGLPASPFKKLASLEVLLLRDNNIGKISVNSFAGLKKTTEIDLSKNALQTLELDMFKDLSSLQEIYLHGNMWHCDCVLKNVEVELRTKGVRTGYIACDSPSPMKGKHLRERQVRLLCGVKSDVLIYSVLGVMSGLITVLFATFLCRRRIAANIDFKDASTRESDADEPRKRSETSSRSSIISNDLGDPPESKASPEKTDLFAVSCEINADLLAPLTMHANDVAHQKYDVIVTSPDSVTTSCPNLSTKIDSFSDLAAEK